MSDYKQSGLVRRAASADPFGMLRQITSELERLFDEPLFGATRLSRFAARGGSWSPGVDVFEKDGRLVTKIDLPGMKKDDVKVEVTDGHLAISGERRTEAEERRENFYRCEREYGSFFRTVQLPDGVRLDDVRATFADGVLEVSVPMPVRTERPVRTIAVEDAAAKAA